MSNQHSIGDNRPWYRQFWPWFIIALPASAVVAGLLTLWIAMSNPDYLVIDDDEYSRLNSGLKAAPPPAEPGPKND
ncbi:MAG: FixH family protein [Xanthomonadales bacterium]|nr:FixH family protein [Xanthomonadales bacterium]